LDFEPGAAGRTAGGTAWRFAAIAHVDASVALPSHARSPVNFPHFLRALASRNYRLFFLGQAASLTGNWMSLTASAWLAYELSGSPFVVGLLAFANQIPVLLLAPFAGVLGDRINRHRLIVALQALCLVQSAALAVVTLSGAMTVPWLLALATFRGLINAAEFPTRQAFIVELVARREDLGNAIALNSSMFNLARLIGPSVAGLVIVTGGPGLCYALDAVSYLPIIAGLLLMRLTPRAPRAGQRHPLAELAAGLRYVANAAALRAPLMLVPVIAATGFAASTLAPVFARDVFGSDARSLGFMYGAVGAGALCSAYFLSTRASAQGLARWVARGALLIGVGQAAFALCTSLAPALVCLAATGMGTVLTMAGSNTLVQSLVDDDKRGRVMGLFTMGQGMFPVGSLLIGLLASATDVRIAVGTAAAVCLVASFVFGRATRELKPAATEPELLNDEL
jgi:MFS family permease